MEDNYILISSLSEYLYCKRRFYLRFLERQNNENIYMIEGSLEHQKVHTNKIEKRKNFVNVSSLSVNSYKYNLIGKCDVVEFLENKNGSYIPFLENNYTLYPIEYKHGKTRDELEYKVQLCAQVLCLEEMYNTRIDFGAIYYIDSKERVEITLDDDLRKLTLETILEIKNLMDSKKVIYPIYKKRCKKCSLVDICNPKIIIVDEYMKNLWEDKDESNK